MFESSEELQAIQAYEEHFPEIAKEMIATAIQAGCSISLDAISDGSAMGIPRSKMFTQACDLSFVINRVLTSAIDAKNISPMTYREDTVGHGRPMIHYLVDRFSLHIKKNRNAHKLPKRALFRLAETKENQQLSLDLNEGISNPMYLIVTFNHKDFHLRYVQIGIASYDYKGWLHRWSLMDYIRQDRADVMRNEYGPAIRENFESISKNYRLEMRH